MMNTRLCSASSMKASVKARIEVSKFIHCALQALHSFITVPQSALVSYTATDKEAGSDITKAVPHNSLSYQVGHFLTFWDPCDSGHVKLGRRSSFIIVLLQAIESSQAYILSTPMVPSSQTGPILSYKNTG